MSPAPGGDDGDGSARTNTKFLSGIKHSLHNKPQPVTASRVDLIPQAARRTYQKVSVSRFMWKH
jgi:hypothetical protein